MGEIISFRAFPAGKWRGAECPTCSAIMTLRHETAEDCLIDLGAEVKAMGAALRRLMSGREGQ